MIRCKKCKYFVYDEYCLGFCKLIKKINCTSWYPVWKCCPFTINSMALVDYITSNYGSLSLKFSKKRKKIICVAKLQGKSNEKVFEVESKAFSSAKDAMSDVLYRIWGKIEELM